jgi:hypothetical protein
MRIFVEVSTPEGMREVWDPDDEMMGALGWERKPVVPPGDAVVHGDDKTGAYTNGYTLSDDELSRAAEARGDDEFGKLVEDTCSPEEAERRIAWAKRELQRMSDDPPTGETEHGDKVYSVKPAGKLPSDRLDEMRAERFPRHDPDAFEVLALIGSYLDEQARERSGG